MKKKERLPRKLKKGLHFIFRRCNTKWKRKAESIMQKIMQGDGFYFVGFNGVEFERGGIVSDRVACKSFVIKEEEQKRLLNLISTSKTHLPKKIDLKELVDM